MIVENKHFSTASVRPDQRFSYWREAVCETYVQLGCEAPEIEDFEGEIKLRRRSLLSVSTVSGKRHTVNRRRQDISRSSTGSFLVSLQMAKTAELSQGGRVAQLEPGDIALYSSIDPYQLELSEHFQQSVIQIPRSFMLTLLPNADMLTGQRLSGRDGIGLVVRKAIAGLITEFNEDRPVLGAHIQQTIASLLATGFASLNNFDSVAAPSDRCVFLRAQTVIRARLSDPDFDRTALSIGLGISIRRLSEIFQAQGTSVAQCIRAMRLERLAHDLRDPRKESASITQIALDCGLTNPQHLARAFRDNFGCSPSEYRLLHRSQ